PTSEVESGLHLQTGTRRKLVVALVVATGVAFPTGLAAAAPSVVPAPLTVLARSQSDLPQTNRLDPTLFANLATGITTVRTFNCGGTATGEGTGFLVGTSVVMTARHVIRGACSVKVLVAGTWMPSVGITSWYTRGRGDLNTG